MLTLLQIQSAGPLPSNTIQLIGFTIAVLSFIVGAFKGVKIWAVSIKDTEVAKSEHRLELEKAKIKKDVDIETAKIAGEVELAKSNQFTAQSVKDMFTHILAVQKELDEMKHSSALTKDHLGTAIEHLEQLLGELSKNFTDFLMNKALGIKPDK